MTTIIFGRVQRIRRRHRWVLQRVAVLNWLRLCGPDDFDSVRCYVKPHHIIVVTTLTLTIIRGSLKQAGYADASQRDVPVNPLRNRFVKATYAAPNNPSPKCAKVRFRSTQSAVSSPAKCCSRPCAFITATHGSPDGCTTMDIVSDGV